MQSGKRGGTPKGLIGLKLGFSVLVFVTVAAFGSTLGIAWRRGSFTLPLLIVFFCISVTVVAASVYKGRQWRARRDGHGEGTR
jgi:ABC-type transport system involved in cytochrome c biogenesis permease component